jgi:hypothetical protein
MVEVVDRFIRERNNVVVYDGGHEFKVVLTIFQPTIITIFIQYYI